MLLGSAAWGKAQVPAVKEKPLPWVEHAVRVGDTAEGIAEQYHTKAQYLLWANDLAPQAPLSSGMVLLVPRSSSEMPATLMEVRARKAQTLRDRAERFAARPTRTASSEEQEKPVFAVKGPQGGSDTPQENEEVESPVLDSMLAAMTPEQRKLFLPRPTSNKPTEGDDVVVESGRQASRAGLIWPVIGRVSSGFGNRGGGKTKSGRVRRGHFHNGIDIPMPKGAPILAAKGGVVVAAGPARGYGQRVVIDHGNGLQTLYSHCSKLFVKKGQRVVQGQRIAAIGRTGRATCNHLHFTVYVRGKARNPIEYLPKRP